MPPSRSTAHERLPTLLLACITLLLYCCTVSAQFTDPTLPTEIIYTYPVLSTLSPNNTVTNVSAAVTLTLTGQHFVNFTFADSTSALAITRYNNLTALLHYSIDYNSWLRANATNILSYPRCTNIRLVNDTLLTCSVQSRQALNISQASAATSASKVYLLWFIPSYNYTSNNVTAHAPLTTTVTFTRTNDCANITCANGASCTNTVGGFTCNCARQFTGTYCEQNNICAASAPCRNNGTCVNGAAMGSYSCGCINGWTGPTCDICDAGYVKLDYFTTVNRTVIHTLRCDPCGPGTYSSTPAATACLRCPINSYNNLTVNTNCTNCTLGFTAVDEGSTKCVAWASGVTLNLYDYPISPLQRAYDTSQGNRSVLANPLFLPHPDIRSCNCTTGPYVKREMHMTGLRLREAIRLEINGVAVPFVRSIMVESETVQEGGILSAYAFPKDKITFTLPAMAPPPYNYVRSVLYFPDGNLTLDRHDLIYVADHNCTEEGFWWDGSECAKCPAGGICKGGGRIWPIRGFFAPNEHTKPFSCPNADSCIGLPAEDYIYGSALPTGHRITWSCSSGYAGNACTGCDTGYYAVGSLCVQCPANQDNSRAYFAVCVLVTTALFFLMSTFVAYAATKTLSMAVGFWLNFEQFILLAQESTQQGAGIMNSIVVVANYFGLVNWDLHFYKQGCFLPRLSFLETYWATISCIIIVGIMFVCACGIRRQLAIKEVAMQEAKKKELELAEAGESDSNAVTLQLDKKRKRKKKEGLFSPNRIFKYRLLHSMLVLGALGYLRMTTLTLEAVHCVDVPIVGDPLDKTPGEYRLVLHYDYTTPCYVGGHVMSAFFIWPFLFIYCAGYPIFCFILLHRAFRRNSDMAALSDGKQGESTEAAAAPAADKDKKDDAAGAKRKKTIPATTSGASISASAADMSNKRGSESVTTVNKQGSESADEHSRTTEPTAETPTGEPAPAKPFQVARVVRQKLMVEQLQLRNRRERVQNVMAVSVEMYGFLFRGLKAKYPYFRLLPLVVNFFRAIISTFESRVAYVLFFTCLIDIIACDTVLFYLPFAKPTNNLEHLLSTFALVLNVIVLLSLSATSEAPVTDPNLPDVALNFLYAITAIFVGTVTIIVIYNRVGVKSCVGGLLQLTKSTLSNLREGKISSLLHMDDDDTAGTQLAADGTVVRTASFVPGSVIRTSSMLGSVSIPDIEEDSEESEYSLGEEYDHETRREKQIRADMRRAEREAAKRAIEERLRKIQNIERAAQMEMMRERAKKEETIQQEREAFERTLSTIVPESMERRKLQLIDTPKMEPHYLTPSRLPPARAGLPMLPSLTPVKATPAAPASSRLFASPSAAVVPLPGSVASPASSTATQPSMPDNSASVHDELPSTPTEPRSWPAPSNYAALPKAVPLITISLKSKLQNIKAPAPLNASLLSPLPKAPVAAKPSVVLATSPPPALSYPSIPARKPNKLLLTLTPNNKVAPAVGKPPFPLPSPPQKSALVVVQGKSARGSTSASMSTTVRDREGESMQELTRSVSSKYGSVSYPSN